MFSITMDVSENSVASQPVASTQDTLKVASEQKVSNKQKAINQIDPVYRKRLKKLRLLKCKNEEEIIAKWPYDPSELEEEDGVYFDSVSGLVILTQSEVPGILEAEWKDVPPSTGRIRFKSRRWFFAWHCPLHEQL